MKKAILGALVLSAFSAVQASAITIDFTNSAWNPPSPTDQRTVGNVTVNADGPGTERLFFSPGEGLGIQSEDDDTNQIEEREVLNVAFNGNFSLTSFSVSRLFDDDDDIDEDGYYRLNSRGSWIKFDGTQSGNRTVVLASPQMVTSLQFGYSSSFNDEDAFFLKNLVGDFQTTQPPSVPEPTSMVLLGTGLAAVVARARRKRA